MPDIESRLRETLRRSLDPIAPDGGRATVAFRRARRGRMARGLAAGLACVLVAAAAAIAWERREEKEPVPVGERTNAQTFVVLFAEGGRATVTIDVPKAQACIAFRKGPLTLSGHLHYDPDGPDPTVAEFRVPTTHLWWPQCVALDPGDAARVIAEPHRHYLDLHPNPAGRVGTLEPFELAPEDAPDVAEIVCSQDGAVAITPQVRPQEDGIHLRFYNPSRRWRAFNLFNGEGENEGGRLSFGRDDNVSRFPPGPLYAGCFDELDDTFLPGDAEYTTFTIVDPDDLWTEPELECDRELERRVVLTDEPFPQDRFALPDFDSLIREHLPGLEPGDVLERPGYPGSEFHFEPRTVVRDGRRIAGLMLVPKDGFWAIHPRVCSGSGIGG